MRGSGSHAARIGEGPGGDRLSPARVRINGLSVSLAEAAGPPGLTLPITPQGLDAHGKRP